MILGMTTETFTLIHVAVSLVAILTGLVAVFGLIGRKRLPAWTGTFLVTTALTCLTGYAFPIMGLTPAHILGAICLAALALACAGLYRFRLNGSWRRVFVISATFALYLNVFVAVVQAFQKIPVLRAAAPTQSEPAFAAAQGLVLVLFIVLGVLATRKFQPVPGVSPGRL